MEYAVVLMSNMVNCKTNREDTAIAKAVAFALSKVDKMKIPMSEEHRRKISESMTGHHPSEETRNRMSKSKTGKKSNFYGKHFSEEAKKRMSEALTGRVFTEEHRKKIRENNPSSKPVLQFSKTGDLIAEYPSIMEAERQTGCNPSHICKCCKGTRKSAGGFIWKYKE